MSHPGATSPRWAKLLADTDALLAALHEAYGDWENVEDFLLGAVAGRAWKDLDASEPDESPDLSDLAVELPSRVCKGGSHD